MSATSLGPSATRRRPPNELAERAERRSLRLLWWIPVSPLVGFAAAASLLSETWPLWQVLPLAVLLAAPFAVGAHYGLHAVRRGSRRGSIGLLLHVAFMILAIVIPIRESLSL